MPRPFRTPGSCAKSDCFLVELLGFAIQSAVIEPLGQLEIESAGLGFCFSAAAQSASNSAAVQDEQARCHPASVASSRGLTAFARPISSMPLPLTGREVHIRHQM